jgi:2,3-diaminopropionate biosynthesis protein SbnA
MNKSEMLDLVGHTPTISIDSGNLENVCLRAKLESCNPTGSVKDRAADYLMRKLMGMQMINSGTTIIESSSGNFGVALAAYCKKYGLKFICVVDPNISLANEMFMRMYQAEVIKVSMPDETGGYLLNRIKKVKELLSSIGNSYWINQYANPYNAEAYYYSIGTEICNENEKLDYIFLGVSSGGTITGISQRVKEKFPNVQVIAVDIEGSVIFGQYPRKRYIPGIGSSMVPDILRSAIIDDVVIVDEITTIAMCHELLRENCIFAGGSSGSVYAAIKKYFGIHHPSSATSVLAVFPDSGWKYLNTIFDKDWAADFACKYAAKKKIEIVENLANS